MFGSTRVILACAMATFAGACASRTHTAEKFDTSGARSSASVASAPDMNDTNIWLETSSDPKVMKWVQDHNAQSVRVLEGDSRFKTIGDEVRAIVTAKDRIPYPTMHNGKVRNFWQDQTHQRGIIRETTLADYLNPNPNWETILDIDALNRAEGKSWVFEGSHCLPPQDDDCLVSLSDGGRDEVVVREFLVSKRTFLPGGFEVPSAKTDVSWIDKDTIFVGTNMGPDSLTTSGYPREVRVWKRGTALADAPVVFSGNKSDVSVHGWAELQPGSSTLYIAQGVSFFEDKVFLYDGHTATALPFPTTAAFQGEFKGQILATLRNDWKTPRKTYLAGSLISIPVASVGQPDAESKIEIVYQPDQKSSFSTLGQARDFLILNILNNVKGELREVTRANGKWAVRAIQLPKTGTVSISDINRFENQFFASYQSFNAPTALYYGSGDFSKPLKKIKSLPAYFDASDIVVDQNEATSKDGTKIPYFLVHKKGMKLNSVNPTLLYGYGGFENAQKPTYSGVIGKVWLEKGGVYALANIRGGGEFGPRWHEAALKEHRQRAYDDFAAVSQDLISRKITSPRRLGIEGGSNGGLLVGVTMTQHPELFNAVICESALLDMIRYTKLPPGASWIGEYGDPADPKVADYISKYSPYQNIQAGITYPVAFFHISTADDRVQPGHTRKMVQRLEDKGHSVLFYENTEGGHGGAADPEQTVHKVSMEFTYLFQKLVD